MSTIEKLVGQSWAHELAPEFDSLYMGNLRDRITVESRSHKVYPEKENIFRAFRMTPLSQVKVLILGQDPYHDGNATGLAFDVGNSPKINPSLRNIKKEVLDDCKTCGIENGNLEHWAQQGVLLLNTVLTVNKGKPNSHAGWGWEKFIAATLTALAFRDPSMPLVVILWGKSAQQYGKYFTAPHQLVLSAPHPAAEVYAGGRAGFFGCGHFSKANDFLVSHNKEEIRW